MTQTLTLFELHADSILPLPIRLSLCLNASYIHALWIKQDAKPLWCKDFLGWYLLYWHKTTFLGNTTWYHRLKKAQMCERYLWDWGQMELTYCFLCSCCTSCGMKNQTWKMKYFSFLSTDPFQLSLWFPLNNDNNMASALGKRCSIPVTKEKWKWKELKWCRRWPWANVFNDLSLDAYVISDYKYYRSHVFHHLDHATYILYIYTYM